MDVARLRKLLDEVQAGRVDVELALAELRDLPFACADLPLVEGAGGLLSPLTWEHDAMDLTRALGVRILLVAADRLGTISHTLMALKRLELNRLETLGVVLTAPEQPDASTGSNAAAISRLSGCSRIPCAPRTRDPKAISDCMQEVTQ